MLSWYMRSFDNKHSSQHFLLLPTPVLVWSVFDRPEEVSSLKALPHGHVWWLKDQRPNILAIRSSKLVGLDKTEWTMKWKQTCYLTFSKERFILVPEASVSMTWQPGCQGYILIPFKLTKLEPPYLNPDFFPDWSLQPILTMVLSG